MRSLDGNCETPIVLLDVDISANRGCYFLFLFFAFVGVAITQLFRLNAAMSASHPSGTLVFVYRGVFGPSHMHILLCICCRLNRRSPSDVERS